MLDQKSPINHLFKGFSPINLLLTSPNPIFGPEFPKEISFLMNKSPILNVV